MYVDPFASLFGKRHVFIFSFPVFHPEIFSFATGFVFLIARQIGWINHVQMMDPQGFRGSDDGGIIVRVDRPFDDQDDLTGALAQNSSGGARVALPQGA